MKARLKFFKLVLAAALLAPMFGNAQDEAQEETSAEQKTVYVIPVRTQIDRALLYVIRRAVTHAEQNKADAIVFDMDTPGGRLDVTKEIIGLISDIDVPVYTYVNTDAISAGAIIAISTKKIYMAPGSRIGDCMPLLMNISGSVEKADENLQEKIVSPTAALIRGSAQQNGHDPELAESMVRREMEYKIGDEVICKEGQLLTLTNLEAERLVGEGDEQRKLLSEGTVSSIDDLMKDIGVNNIVIKRYEVTSAERIASMIERFSSIFLIIGVLGIYLEIKTPGFGLPGIVGAIFLGIFFWGHNIAGLAGMPELVLFLVGVALLALEIFVIPGFGIAGVSGICLIAASLLMAMIQHYPSGPWLPPIEHFVNASRNLSISILVCFGAMILLAKFLPKTAFGSKLIMPEAIDSHISMAPVESGAISIGITGLAVTPLRPSGKADFGDIRVDVVTEGDFIEKDSKVEVIEVHGNRIVVAFKG